MPQSAPLSPHVLFAGGGSTGRFHSAMAVAAALRQRLPHIRCSLAGGGNPRERQLAAAAGCQYVSTPCHPLPRRGRGLVRFTLDNLAGYRAAEQFLAQQHVDVMVGLGGYASVPMALAARRMRIPLALLEHNVAAGRANRWLAAGAALVCAPLPATAKTLHVRGQFAVTGNPVRREIVPPTVSPTERRVLLVIGGGQATSDLNRLLPAALAQLGHLPAGWRVVHQTGEQQYESTRNAYVALSVPAVVQPHFHDFPHWLASAGMAISHASGTMLAELAVSEAPAVLCSQPHASDSHQHRNAEAFERAGAARRVDLLVAGDRGAAVLAGVLRELLWQDAARLAMSAAMRQLARPHAADDVAQRLLELIGVSPVVARAA